MADEEAPHILVVDDDAGVRATLSAILRADGFRDSLAEDVAAARKILATDKIDLILLDVRMPGEDGIGFTRELRAGSPIPIIMVSGQGDDIDRVLGLEMGADDYIAKPFNRRELVARIRAVLRRTQPAPEKEETAGVRRFEGWTLDVVRRRLFAPDGSEVPLTRGEFALLEAFTRRPGHVLSRDQLLDLTGGPDRAPLDRTVDVMVGRLRRKLGDTAESPRMLITVYGMGYLFAPAVSSS